MKMLLALPLTLSLLIADLAFSSVSANKINSLIKKNHEHWIASDNKISQLNDIELKRLLGSNELPTGSGLFENLNLESDMIDWRNVNGINWLGPVMNQGNCGSCVAFATVATLEATYRINSNLPWLTPSFSPQQLFNCGGGSCDSGWFPSSAVNFLKKKGIVDSACAPYESGSTGNDVQCKKNFCQHQDERTYKIPDSASPTFWGGSAEKVKTALKKGPLITTMMVYEDFLVYKSGIYKSVSKKTVGGHAVSLVGFNDEERYWIVRNSWGEDWGEKGFIRISYDDKSGVAESTWALQTNTEKQYISISFPKDHDYLSGQQQIIQTNSHPLTGTIFIDSENEHYQLPSCDTASVECETQLDTTKMKDGRYEIYSKSSNARSQVTEFFVLNNEPKTTISFKGKKGIDLKKAQSGRIEFDIDVKANPVIPQRISFIVENQDGKIVSKRTTEQVVPAMRLGFRTNTLENGKYTIYYSAETPFEDKIITTNSNKELLIIKN